MMNTSPAPNARQAAAVALVESHLQDIKAHRILRRCVNGMVVWLVKGTDTTHVVTLDPVVSCDCPDFQHRHPADGCKHIQAIKMLVTPAQPAPAAPIAWTSDTRKARRGRTELQEEI